MSDFEILEPKGKNKFLYSEIEKIYKKDNKITPEKILELAKDKKHPLHKYFEWDDTVAANKYRLIQARELIRSVLIVVKNRITKEKFKVRAFLNVNIDDDGCLTVNGNQKTDNFYVSQQVVKEDDKLIKYQLIKAKAELKVFKEKYRVLKDYLPELFDVIDKI